MHHPYVSLVLSLGKRLAWSAFGASLATAFFATRAAHVPIAPAVAAVPVRAPVTNTVTFVVPQLERAEPARAVTVPTLPATTTAEPWPRRALGPTDAKACSRAWAEGGIYRAAYGVTYVTRDAIDRALENQADLARSSRIVPESVDGKVVGVKMFGVRPGSAMDRLGFENGDSLRTVNGYDVVSPERALEAYAKLRTSSDYHVAIARSGAAMVLIYRVC